MATNCTSLEEVELTKYLQTLPFLQRNTDADGRDRFYKTCPSQSFRYRLLKRGFDITFVLLGLPLWFPLLCIVAIAVKLDSPGNLLFSHRRVCDKGAFFSMWKFRTMCTNSAEVLEEHLLANEDARLEWARTHKLVDDPRVSTVGAYLRKYSLDELPQMFNVLDGSMTLVGPRPITAAEIEKYGDSFDRYSEVKPGLTGLWQVSGRSALSYEQRVQLDVRYVNSWSLWLDTRILVKTVITVAKSHGAV